MSSIHKIFLLIMGLQITACADLSYYLHSVKGQLSIMQKTQSIDDLLQHQETELKLRQNLELIGDIRQFAFEQLHLPESDSYTEYADLGRRYVLKNLFASDEFSISLQRWCYPIVGCAGYRGYFDEQMLQQFKENLQQQGKDIYIAKVPAYSTLGWFDDPVLNTFIYWPEYRLAGLIFHELAHQRLYIDDDSQFNESFAVAVQQTGVEKWLQQSHQYKKLIRYKQYLKNRQKVIGLIEQARYQLNLLYQRDLDEVEKRRLKQLILVGLRQRYQQVSAEFTVSDGFKYWFQGELNNAKLASISTYHTRVNAFRRLLESHHGDYASFFIQVKMISGLNKIDRHQCLQKWDKMTDEPANC